MKHQWRNRLLETAATAEGACAKGSFAGEGPLRRQLTEGWMKQELKAILASFSEEQLENLARAHYIDAVELLKQALVEYPSDLAAAA